MPGKDDQENRLIDEIDDAVGSVPDADVPEDACRVDRYRHLVKTSCWTEMRRAADGAMQEVNVTAQLWSEAIQKALNDHQAVVLVEQSTPYYLDRPIVLKSGSRLLVEGNSRIILKPASNCSMVRNEHVICGQRGKVDLHAPDTDLVIAGGIWSTLATGRHESNGNLSGALEAGGRTNEAFCTHGTFALSNVEKVRIANVTFHECRLHGIQLGNCRRFIVENIRFEKHRRDGVHINGSASYGVIQNIRHAAGVMGDDLISLTAWDWKHTSTTFGPIDHILVRDVDGASANCPAAPSAIRLLSGTKVFPDKETWACDIADCVFHDISGVDTFKMYDQPNLELAAENDHSEPIGHMANLYFRDIQLGTLKEPAFQVALNVDGLAINDLRVSGPPDADTRLIRIGPESRTYTFGQTDSARWVEVFSPDSVCTVRRLEVSLVDPAHAHLHADDVVEVLTQRINPHYPRTTPRGGTGKGVWIRG